MLTSRRLKTTAIFTALAFLLIGTGGVCVVYAHTESGYAGPVYYEFRLDDLETGNDWAYSYHYFYIINTG